MKDNRKRKMKKRNKGVGVNWHPEELVPKQIYNVMWVDEDGDLIDTRNVMYRGIKVDCGVLWTRWKSEDGMTFLLNIKDIVNITNN